MKKLIVFILIAFTSCKMTKIEGAFVNSNLQPRDPIFFSFKNDSLFVKYHKLDEFIGLQLNYKNNKVVAQNDSYFLDNEELPLKFEITQNNFSLDVTDVGVSTLFKEVINITPIKINYQNKDSMAGFWLSTDVADFEETWLYVNDKLEVISASSFKDELVYFANEGEIIYGKIIKINNEYYFNILVDTIYQVTILLDKIDDESLQMLLIDSDTNTKYFQHFKKVNFSKLPRELKEEVIKQEIDTARFDSEKRILKGLEVISSDYEDIEDIEIFEKKTK